MITRTIVSLIGGGIAAFLVLIFGWMVVEAMTVVGPWIPFAAFISVALALWFVDFASDYLEARRK